MWPDATTLVTNDVTAAGLAVRQRADEDFCVVTVSSGIGVKVFIGAASCWDLGQQWDEMIELRGLDGLAGLVGAGRYAREVTP